VGTCPEVFRMEGDKAIANRDPVSAGLQECCRKAAEECPVAAIEVTE
jgi:ferredoxin